MVRTERAILNHLIEANLDAERGLRLAEEQATSPAVRRLFGRLADQHREFATDLEPHAQRLGGDGAAEGTTIGSIHRFWTRLRTRFAANTDDAVIEEAARGEGFVIAAYNEAVEDVLSPFTRELVEAQTLSVRTARRQVDSIANVRYAEPNAAKAA